MTNENTNSDPKVANLDVFRESKSLGREAWERLIRNRAAVAGMIIIGFFLLVAIFAPVIAPANPLKINDGKSYLPPPWFKGQTAKVGEQEHFLGTDTLGRDVLSRTIYGARVSMVVAVIPTLIILIIGTTVGMISGYVGGRTDNVLMRITDVIYAFPDLLFFIIVMVALRDSPLGQMFNGMLLLFVAFAIVNWVSAARLTRGQALSLKNKEFVEASRSIGVKDSRIMTRHILPNSLSPLIVYSALLIPGLDHHGSHPGLPGHRPAAGNRSERHLHHQLGCVDAGGPDGDQHAAVDPVRSGVVHRTDRAFVHLPRRRPARRARPAHARHPVTTCPKSRHEIGFRLMSLNPVFYMERLMARNRFIWQTIVAFTILFGLAACQPPVTETPSLPESTPTPIVVSDTPAAETRSLTICLGAEPNTLYPLGEPNAAAKGVLAAIYDGPIDSNSYGYQPVILKKLPSIADGDAVLAPVDVSKGTLVLDVNGNVVALDKDIQVFPSGCTSSNCAVKL